MHGYYFCDSTGYTQKELAEIIGIKQTLISDYETGRIRIFAEMLAIFAIALKVSTDDLVGLKEEESNNQQISLRLVKRLQRIESLPKNKQKTILSSLDMMIDSAEKN